jgi:hypothetical protein
VNAQSARRPAVLVLVLALACPTSLSAQPDKYAWSSYADADAALLTFGVPESELVAFVLYCDHKKRRVDLTVVEEIRRARVGRPLSIELSAGAARIMLRGRTRRDERIDFVHGEAIKIALEPIVRVLRTAGELTVKMGTAEAKYPERGRKQALARFLKACKFT